MARTPFFHVLASVPSVNEGSKVTFSFHIPVTSQMSFNYLSGKKNYVDFKISGVTKDDIVGGLLSGTAEVNSNGSGTFTIEIAQDNNTEGPEILTASVLTYETTVTINDTSTKFNSADYFNNIYGTSASETINGTGLNDLIFGYAGNDQIFGGVGDDVIDGGLGNNIIDGGTGGDEMYGDIGNDIYYVDSKLDFIEDAGGIDTAYVSADFVKIPSYIEKIIYQNNAQPLPYWISALLPDEASGLDFLQMLGDAKTYYYTFPQRLPTYATNPADSNLYATFGVNQIAKAKEALAYISNVVGLSFVQTTNSAAQNTITFANNSQSDSAGYSYFPSENFFYGSDIFINRKSGFATFADGTYEAITLIHEIGHAIGLKHPFDDTDSVGNTGTPPYLSSKEDITTWTVMSYTALPSDYHMLYSPLDIAALQYLYGPSLLTRNGNDSYRISQSDPNFIWDGVGTDTIDASGVNQGATIYLTSGYWGFIGSKALTITSPGQVTVNFGTTIEYLTGSAFDDQLYGNEVANVINGGNGKDTIQGWGGNDSLFGGSADDELLGGDGNDSIDGGDGTDTAVFNLTFADYSITFSESTKKYTVSASSGLEGSDQLINVENFKFKDKSISVQSLGLNSPTYSLTPIKASFDEGNAAAFSLVTTNVAAGTSLTYSITGVVSSDLTNGLLSGITVIGSDGQSTISIDVKSDNATEGPETLTVTVFGSSASAIIKDTSISTVTNELHNLSVIVDRGVISPEAVLLKGLVEKIALANGVITMHTIQYAGMTFDYSQIDSLITTVTRDEEFTTEFTKEINDYLKVDANIAYKVAVGLVGIGNIDSVILTVAGADGSYVN